MFTKFPKFRELKLSFSPNVPTIILFETQVNTFLNDRELNL